MRWVPGRTRSHSRYMARARRRERSWHTDDEVLAFQVIQAVCIHSQPGKDFRPSFLYSRDGSIMGIIFFEQHAGFDSSDGKESLSIPAPSHKVNSFLTVVTNFHATRRAFSAQFILWKRLRLNVFLRNVQESASKVLTMRVIVATGVNVEALR